MSDYSHSFERPEVGTACAELISRNAEYLINYIYDHTEEPPFNDPYIRVGVVLKTLLRSGNDSVVVNSNVIEPATQDLTDIVANTTTQVERSIYIEELKFLRTCTLLDDLISLNTAVP